jgi:hypothetical protein
MITSDDPDDRTKLVSAIYSAASSADFAKKTLDIAIEYHDADKNGAAPRLLLDFKDAAAASVAAAEEARNHAAEPEKLASDDDDDDDDDAHAQAKNEVTVWLSLCTSSGKTKQKVTCVATFGKKLVVQAFQNGTQTVKFKKHRVVSVTVSHGDEEVTIPVSPYECSITDGVLMLTDMWDNYEMGWSGYYFTQCEALILCDLTEECKEDRWTVEEARG